MNKKPESATLPGLRPFRPLRYGTKAGALDSLLAPPYDVISPEDAAALRRRSPHNAVWLVLPEGEGDARYNLAAGLFARWMRDGALVEERPGVFVYRQTFEADGHRVSRHSLFAALRLAPFSERSILPHERTHSGPRRDRLALTLATRAQLSPVFLIARDPDLGLLRCLSAVADAAASASAGTPDGIQHDLWGVGAGPAARRLCESAARQPLLIADGHHRYETALEVARQLGGNVKARYVLACVASDRDPGLFLRPTHRCLAAVPPLAGATAWEVALSAVFSMEWLADSAAASPEQVAEHTVVVLPGAGGDGSSRAARLVPRRTVLAAENLTPAEARVPSVLFDRLVLRKLYGIDADEAAETGLLTYHRLPSRAAAAAAGCGAAFLLPPPRLADVWDIAAAGGRLPPKTTYFEPKIPSGLVFRRL